jgi:hypothetical protein
MRQPDASEVGKAAETVECFCKRAAIRPSYPDKLHSAKSQYSTTTPRQSRASLHSGKMFLWLWLFLREGECVSMLYCDLNDVKSIVSASQTPTSQLLDVWAI